MVLIINGLNNTIVTINTFLGENVGPSEITENKKNRKGPVSTNTRDYTIGTGAL